MMFALLDTLSLSLCGYFCGEVANINFMIFGFIRPLLARTIQRIRDGYDNHYTTDVDLQEKYVQLV